MVHRVTVKVNNSTPFTLQPNGQYAHWGETKSGPDRVDPYRSDGNGGVFKASAAPWVGCAGISGYTVRDGGNNILAWITLLVSDPDWSAEANRARVLLSLSSTYTDKDAYNRLFDGRSDGSAALDHGQLDLNSTIGSEDDTTATFNLIFRKGSGVTADALSVNVTDHKLEAMHQKIMAKL